LSRSSSGVLSMNLICQTARNSDKIIIGFFKLSSFKDLQLGCDTGD
jgi:hypothetical protein